MNICACGCGGETKPNRRFINHHNNIMKRKGYVVGEGGCWIYQGHIDKRGYTGSVFFNGRRMTAYKAHYEEKHGQVPEGKELDHLCRNRKCVNPDHLEVVTSRENIRRSPCSKLHVGGKWSQVLQMLAGGMSQTEVARVMGCTQSAVSHALRINGLRGKK